MDDAELRALLAAQSRLIAELSERLAPTRRSVPLVELYARYDVAQKHRAGWRSARCMIAPIVAQFTGRDAAGLVVSDWTAYRVARTDLAPSSLNQALRLFKTLLRWGKREGFLEAHPQLCEARKQTAKRGRETAPIEDDVAKLLKEARGALERLMVLAACDAGLRNGEIRRLERSWVDRERMEIHLPASITKSRRARTVPITARLLAAIDNVPRDIRSALLLPSPVTGRAYSQVHLSMTWRLLAERAELQAAPGEVRVRLHDGRHGFATNAAKRGVRIEVLQKILGHASLDQTREYVTTSDEDLPAARALFEAGIKRDRR